jgi:hypothetical protein
MKTDVSKVVPTSSPVALALSVFGFLCGVALLIVTGAYFFEAWTFDLELYPDLMIVYFAFGVALMLAERTFTMWFNWKTTSMINNPPIDAERDDTIKWFAGRWEVITAKRHMFSASMICIAGGVACVVTRAGIKQMETDSLDTNLFDLSVAAAIVFGSTAGMMLAASTLSVLMGRAIRAVVHAGTMCAAPELTVAAGAVKPTGGDVTCTEKLTKSTAMICDVFSIIAAGMFLAGGLLGATGVVEPHNVTGIEDIIIGVIVLMVFAVVFAAINIVVAPLLEIRESKDKAAAAWKESSASITFRNVLELIAHASIALAALRHIDSSVTATSPTPIYVLVLTLLIMPSIHTLASFAGKKSAEWVSSSMARKLHIPARIARMEISNIAMMLYAIGAAMPIVGVLSLVDAISLEAADTWPIVFVTLAGFVFLMWIILLLVNIPPDDDKDKPVSLTERPDAVALSSHLTATLTIVGVLLFLNEDHDRRDGTSIQFLISQVLVITSGSFSVASMSLGSWTHHYRNALFSPPKPQGLQNYSVKIQA